MSRDSYKMTGRDVAARYAGFADEEASAPRRKTGAGAMSEMIVDAIIADLSDRSGLGGEWDQIDDGIRAEIRSAWMLMARRLIERG